MPSACYGYPEPPRDDHNGPAAEALCKVLQEHEAQRAAAIAKLTPFEIALLGIKP